MTLIGTGSFKDTKNIETLILEAYVVSILSTCRFQVNSAVIHTPKSLKDLTISISLSLILSGSISSGCLRKLAKSHFLCLPYTNIQVVKG